MTHFLESRRHCRSLGANVDVVLAAEVENHRPVEHESNVEIATGLVGRAACVLVMGVEEGVVKGYRATAVPLRILVLIVLLQHEVGVSDCRYV